MRLDEGRTSKGLAVPRRGGGESTLEEGTCRLARELRPARADPPGTRLTLPRPQPDTRNVRAGGTARCPPPARTRRRSRLPRHRTPADRRPGVVDTGPAA